MKSIKIYLYCIAMFMGIVATAQVPTKKTPITPVKKELVEITKPGIRSVYVLSNFFNDGIKKELLKQISGEQLEQIKNNCNEDNYPACIKELIANDDAAASNTDAKEDNRFKKLKIYRIATFDNIRNGENFGEESVLVVPAAENKNIGGTCSFTDDFYIIIYTRGIKVL